MKFSKLKILIISAIIVSIYACTNPFAPGIKHGVESENSISDQKTIEGFFQNFRYAYTAQDTTIYGNLLHPDFSFIYKNYDNYQQAVDVSWGREEDVITTARLFNATQNIDLTWNEISNSTGDSVLVDITRGFTLTIIFNPSDIIDIHGNAILRLQRPTTDDQWKLIRWRDESNF